MTGLGTNTNLTIFSATGSAVSAAELGFPGAGANGFSATATSGLVIRGTFAAGDLADPKRIIQVNLGGAIGSAAGGVSNGLQTFRTSQTFAAGETFGPRLTAVSGITPITTTDAFTGISTTVYRFTVTFDQIVPLRSSTVTGVGSTTTVVVKTLKVDGTSANVTATVVAPASDAALGTTLTLQVSALADLAQLNAAVQLGFAANGITDGAGRGNYEAFIAPS
jgi:hypothetical protein